MTIGVFARASLLSVKSLRAYHEAGILVPAEIDPESGYRRYHPGQLADAKLIRRLRDLDLPLVEVARVVEARDPGVTADILDAHRRRMDERLADTQRIVDELSASGAEPTATPVHVRRIDHAHALARRGSVPAAQFPDFLGAAFAALWTLAGEYDLKPASPVGALYAPELHDGPTEDVTAYLPIEPPPALPEGTLEGRGLELIELPALTVAVAVHVGPYDSIGDTYADIGAWVALEAEPSGEPVREIYTVSYGADLGGREAEPADFRTEICWPVRA